MTCVTFSPTRSVCTWCFASRREQPVHRELGQVDLHVRAGAVCPLVAIAMIHSDNRTTAEIAMGIFATGVAISWILIARHDRPFSGDIHIQPDVLLQSGRTDLGFAE